MQVPSLSGQCREPTVLGAPRGGGKRRLRSAGAWRGPAAPGSLPAVTNRADRRHSGCDAIKIALSLCGFPPPNSSSQFNRELNTRQTLMAAYKTLGRRSAAGRGRGNRDVPEAAAPGSGAETRPPGVTGARTGSWRPVKSKDVGINPGCRLIKIHQYRLMDKCTPQM